MTSMIAEATTGMMRDITLQFVESEHDFECLSNEWNRLLLQCHRPVPFLTWEWAFTWWQHFGRESKLFVVVARNQCGEIVGIAPLHIVVRKKFGLLPVRCVEFLGYRGSAVCTDHLDFLARPSQRLLINRLLLNEVVRRQDNWDCVAFTDLAEDSLIPDLMTAFAGDIQSLPGERCPYIELPSKWETLLSLMKKKHRTELKRRRERLTKFHVRFELSNEPDRVRAYLEDLGRLHSSSRHRHGESGNFAIPAYREFHCVVAERMAQAGYLYMARLNCDDHLVACLYGFYCGRRIFGYQTGFDADWASQGVGAVLQSYVLEDVIERLHAAEYDFLRGTEEYKYRWTDRERTTKSIAWWRPSLTGYMARTDFLARNRIGIAGRKFLKNWGSRRDQAQVQ